MMRKSVDPQVANFETPVSSRVSSRRKKERPPRGLLFCRSWKGPSERTSRAITHRRISWSLDKGCHHIRLIDDQLSNGVLSGRRTSHILRSACICGNSACHGVHCFRCDNF